MSQKRNVKIRFYSREEALQDLTKNLPKLLSTSSMRKWGKKENIKRPEVIAQARYLNHHNDTTSEN